MTPTVTARVHGCLLGSAIGDALGAPVEFMKLDAIKKKYGPNGIQEFDEAYGMVGALTDDTQMTIFTAEGLLDTLDTDPNKIMQSVHASYQRWLASQCYADFSPTWSGFIQLLRENASRAPGTTCLSALAASRGKSAPHKADNDSCGCGGVMRVAPVGLLAKTSDEAFYLGVRTAMLTHGSPEGYLPAGVIAAVINKLIYGTELFEAVEAAYATLRCYPLAGPTCDLVCRAMDTKVSFKKLGEGWRGDEAMAIALRCALTGTSFIDGVRRAVNHDGDSDSVGAIAGALLGAMYGCTALPAHMVKQLEHVTFLKSLANDIVLRLPTTHRSGIKCPTPRRSRA
jgi:ADP-ribosylglycohydrolase